jgi:hypothetical protein
MKRPRGRPWSTAGSLTPSTARSKLSQDAFKAQGGARLAVRASGGLLDRLDQYAVALGCPRAVATRTLIELAFEHGIDRCDITKPLTPERVTRYNPAMKTQPEKRSAAQRMASYRERMKREGYTEVRLRLKPELVEALGIYLLDKGESIPCAIMRHLEERFT